MTRKGKIARLPNEIREQINSRLQDGEEGKSILSWLNSLPKVQTILADLFDGRPVNHANLSDWKLGGYRDWLLQQDVRQFARDLQDENPLGHKDLGRTSGSYLLHRATIQYAATAKALIINELDPKAKWARLRELCADVTLLHRAQLTAERIAHEDYWIDRKESKDRDETPKHRGTKHLNTGPTTPD